MMSFQTNVEERPEGPCTPTSAVGLVMVGFYKEKDQDITFDGDDGTGSTGDPQRVLLLAIAGRQTFDFLEVNTFMVKQLGKAEQGRDFNHLPHPFLHRGRLFQGGDQE